MRTYRNPFLFAALLGALALFPACGGGDDEPDAAETIDANETPDAPGGGDLVGLGQVCTDNPDCVTGEATVCAALDANATQGFCTLSCGTSTSTDTPPTGGDATCAAAFMGETPAQGTPLCAIYSGTAPNVMWYCAVACGTAGTMELGGCPDGLTCTANICQ